MNESPSPATVTVPDYSGTPRDQVPDACKWRIADLFSDPAAWRAGFGRVKELAAGLEPLAQAWTRSPRDMGDFMDRLDQINQQGGRLAQYATLQNDMDLGDPRYQAMKGEVHSFLVELGARLAFMEPELLALGEAEVERYVREEPRLAPHRVGFLRILRMKEHILPEGEARVEAHAGLFGYAPSGAAGMLTDLDMPRPEVTLSTGEQVVLNTANYQKHRAAKSPADRKLVMETYWAGQKRYENTLATLLDAGIKQDLFHARVHRYPSCLDAALYPDAIDPAVYRNLVATVRANLAPLHRLLALRQRMLGLPELRYADLYASAVGEVTRTYGYDEARDLVLQAVRPLGPGYGQALEGAFRDGWIDVYPNLGKQSGAYSSGVYGVHPFVKMNYDGTFHNVSTLAHELGHAMHSYLSERAQPYPTADYPIFLAEIASTCNENLLMHALLETERDATLKLFLLDNYLETLRGTLFRQTLFAEFELAMHERVGQGQSLTPDWLNATYLELTRHYYGHAQGVVQVDDYIQAEWSGIPHFFYNYYVYQYATGIVASMALAEAVLAEGEPARERYLAFLGSGSSQFPLDTLKAAGVDLTTPGPVASALRAFDGLVARMEALYDQTLGH
jgi:oligoendopeptidase F